MRSINVKQGQDLFAVAIQERGNVLFAFDIARANNMAVTDPLFPGEIILIPEPGTYKATVTEFAEEFAPVPVAENYKLVPVRQGQNLFDLSLQELGSAEGVLEIALKNGMSPTQQLVTGYLLRVPGTTTDKTVAKEMKRLGIYPASLVGQPSLQLPELFEPGLFEPGLFEQL